MDPPLSLASATSLSCSHCGESFQRREHRDRHVLRHTGAKPFVCQICQKSFSRNDTLVRHHNLHARARSGQEPSPDSGPASRRRRVQACLSCAKVKQRCEGGIPCARCIVKGVNCSNISRDVSARAIASPVLRPRPGGSEAPPNELPDDTRTAVSQSRPTGFLEQFHVNTPAIPSGSDTGRASPSLSLSFPLQDLMIPTLAFDPGMAPDDLTTDFTFPFTLPWPMEGLDYSTEDINVATMLTNAALPHTEGQRLLDADNICSAYSRVCPPFPDLQADSLETIGAEIHGHISQLSAHSTNDLHSFYITQQRDATSSAPIPLRALHAFVELYFEHFDMQFPFVHPSRLDNQDVSWVLLLAIAAVGSHYSTLKQAPEYTAVLTDLLERAVESLVSVHMAKADISIIQAIFMLHVLWTYSGSIRDKIVHQQKRGILATLCRDLSRNPDGLGVDDRSARPADGDTDFQVEQKWLIWLALEEQVRTYNCIRGRWSDKATSSRLLRMIC